MTEIRTATTRDLDFVRALWAIWWEEAPLRHRTRAETMQTQALAFQRALQGWGVCLIAPGAGVLLWVEIAPRELTGYGVFVRKAHRAEGLGGALIREGLKRAKEAGYRMVWVAPYVGNSNTIQWLDRFGFVETQLVMGRQL